MKHLVIQVERESHSVESVEGMTVKELIDELKRHDPNATVAIKRDGMYSSVNTKFMPYEGDWDAFVEVNK